MHLPTIALAAAVAVARFPQPAVIFQIVVTTLPRVASALCNLLSSGNNEQCLVWQIDGHENIILKSDDLTQYYISGPKHRKFFEFFTQ